MSGNPPTKSAAGPPRVAATPPARPAGGPVGKHPSLAVLCRPAAVTDSGDAADDGWGALKSVSPLDDTTKSSWGLRTAAGPRPSAPPPLTLSAEATQLAAIPACAVVVLCAQGGGAHVAKCRGADERPPDPGTNVLLVVAARHPCLRAHVWIALLPGPAGARPGRTSHADPPCFHLSLSILSAFPLKRGRAVPLLCSAACTGAVYSHYAIMLVAAPSVNFSSQEAQPLLFP